MKIKGVDIDFKLERRIPGRQEVRTFYRGLFSCPGRALDGKSYHQMSHTKVAYVDEWGQKEWGDPVTTFTLDGDIIPFTNLEELITHYNDEVEMRRVTVKGVTMDISENGKVVMCDGRRYKSHWVETSGRAYRLTIKQKAFYLHRLVAEAFLGQPPKKGMAVQYRDDDVHNLHHTNLYYSTSRCPISRQNKPDPNSKRSKQGLNTLNKKTII